MAIDSFANDRLDDGFNDPFAPATNSLETFGSEAEDIAVEDDAIEHAQALLNTRKAELEARKEKLHQAMAAAGVESFKTRNGLRPRLRKEAYANTQSGAYEHMIEWVKSLGEGYRDQVREGLRSPSSLKTICKSVREDGLALPDFINFGEKLTLTLGEKTAFLRNRSEPCPNPN